MISPDEAIQLLREMARQFEEAAEVPRYQAEARGWGQFLDPPSSQRQVGPYGTSSGLAVLALAERGASLLVQQALTLIAHWWAVYRRDQEPEPEASRLLGYVDERFVQTLRMAMINFALRLTARRTELGRALHQDVSSRLEERLLPSQMWGDFWSSAQLHDPTDRLFPTAVALTSFGLIQNPGDVLPDSSLMAARKLQQVLIASPDLPIEELIIGACGTLAVLKQETDARLLRRIEGLTTLDISSLKERPYHFYYEYTDTEGEPFGGRDYFIVPTEVILAIVGLLDGAPGGLRLLSESLVGRVADNIRRNGGAYRTSASSRISTLDQIWVAALLTLVRSPRSSTSKFSRLDYQLRRYRRDNWFTGVFLPGFAMISVTAMNVYLKDVGTTAQSAIGAIAILIIGGMYGSSVFRHLGSRR